MTLQDHFQGSKREIQIPVSVKNLEKLRTNQRNNYSVLSISDVFLFALFSHQRVALKNKRKSKPLSESDLDAILGQKSNSSLSLPTNMPDTVLSALAISIPNLRFKGNSKKNRNIDDYAGALVSWMEKRILPNK